MWSIEVDKIQLKVSSTYNKTEATKQDLEKWSVTCLSRDLNLLTVFESIGFSRYTMYRNKSQCSLFDE